MPSAGRGTRYSTVALVLDEPGSGTVGLGMDLRRQRARPSRFREGLHRPRHPDKERCRPRQIPFRGRGRWRHERRRRAGRGRGHRGLPPAGEPGLAGAGGAPGRGHRPGARGGRGLAARLGCALATTEVAELLADPSVQAVVIAARPFRADLVEAAAGAGKAVFCEKPMTLTLADADRAVAPPRRRGAAAGRVQPALRLRAGFEAAHDLVAAGQVGTRNCCAR